MTSVRCAMAPLIEAKRDGRLGEREQGSIDRHLSACAECRLFASDLEKIACLARADADSLTPLERHRGRTRLLQRAALAPAPRPRRSALPWKLALPAVALLLSAIAAAAGGALRPSFFRSSTAAPLPALPPSALPRALLPAPTSPPELLAEAESAQPTVQPAPLDPPAPPRPPPIASHRPSAPPSGAPSARPEDGARVLAEGIAHMEKGDYGAAAERMRAFQKARPNDARAEDAAFLEIIALQRAGRNDEAIAAAHAYLAAHPNGYRRAEAEAIARGH